MTLHDDSLTTLRAWNAPTKPLDALRRRYLSHLEQHPDGLSRTCLPDHITASTLVFDADRTRVLLTLHSKSKRWFQFGGHCEAQDQTLAGVALRETVEESGLAVADLILDPRPVLLDAHAVAFCGPDGALHLDVMFHAVAREGAQHSASEESIDVAWWPIDALPDDELVRFVEAAQERDASDQPSK